MGSLCLCGLSGPLVSHVSAVPSIGLLSLSLVGFGGKSLYGSNISKQHPRADEGAAACCPRLLAMTAPLCDLRPCCKRQDSAGVGTP